MRRIAAMTGVCLAASIAAAEPARVTIPPLHADGRALTGFLQLPPAAEAAPFPALVLMHGCSGPVTPSGKIRARERDWMERFARAGYASLLVDSFNPRGVRSTCGRPTAGLSAEEDRPFDAYAALRWLKKRSDIDGARIALMGWSHGGTSVLSAASDRMAGELAPRSGRFALAIAFYPGCRLLSRGGWRPGGSIMMHLGGADDWTPPHNCQSLARRAAQAGGGVETWLYPGAHHGFDGPAGEVRERRLPSDRVVHHGPDPAARALSIERTMSALGRAFAREAR